MELISMLNNIHPLSDGLKEWLTINLKSRELYRKDYLLIAGQISRHVCFIVKGLLRCFYVKEGQEVTSWFMNEGNVIFSISSFYDQKASYESIQAIEDCRLYYLTFEELEYVYHHFPEFNYIGRVLTIRYHQLWDQQLYSLRMQNAAERYQWLLSHYPDLLLRVPAKHIASYLGITSVTLSNIKSKQMRKNRPSSDQ